MQKLPKTKLEDSGLRDDSTKNKTEEKDFVLQVDSVKGINSTKIKEMPKELVVPCPFEPVSITMQSLSTQEFPMNEWTWH